VLLASAIAWTILQNALLRSEGPNSRLAAALGNNLKGNLSLVLYLAAVPLAFVHQAISDVIYVSVALMWLIPDRRIEATLK
jgi:uncharacterized membrane protein